MHTGNSPQNKPTAKFALSRRDAMVARMAADLVRMEAYVIERDSMRALSGSYPMADIILLVDDARQAAFQDVVAREMGKP